MRLVTFDEHRDPFIDEHDPSINGQDPSINEHGPSLDGRGPSTTPSRRFLLFSKARTASNLLMRIMNLNEQPSLLPGEQRDYYFFDVLMKRGSWSSDDPAAWTDEEKEGRMKDFQACFDDFHGHVQRAESQCKDVWVKEHTNAIELRRPQSYSDANSREITVDVPGAPKTRTSDVVFSDEYLKTWRPTFLIRHPALCFPSLYRALNDIQRPGLKTPADALTVDMQLRTTRSLYEWYMKHCDHLPLVLDAQDVITRPDVVVAWAKQVGLDPKKMKFIWEPGRVDIRAGMPEAVAQRFFSTLTDSKGIDASKAPRSIDIDVEAVEWKQEFGEEMGAKIEKLVRDAMPDYEFLTARRVQVATMNSTVS